MYSIVIIDIHALIRGGIVRHFITSGSLQYRCELHRNSKATYDTSRSDLVECTFERESTKLALDE